jgi:hypothetical protein
MVCPMHAHSQTQRMIEEQRLWNTCEYIQTLMQKYCFAKRNQPSIQSTGLCTHTYTQHAHVQPLTYTETRVVTKWQACKACTLLHKNEFSYMCSTSSCTYMHTRTNAQTGLQTYIKRLFITPQPTSAPSKMVLQACMHALCTCCEVASESFFPPLKAPFFELTCV